MNKSACLIKLQLIVIHLFIFKIISQLLAQYPAYLPDNVSLEQSGDQEYYRAVGNFFKWRGELNIGNYPQKKIDECPVDALLSLSLCAPLPVFMSGDSRMGTCGIYLTAANTTPVYELL